jgi:O-acetylhomoserine (thiol)-lyase
VLTFRIKGGLKDTVQFVEKLQIISHIANIGDVRTLITHPASTTHRQLNEKEQKAAGIFPDLLRLSLGLEHIDDLKKDIALALE